MVKVDTAQAAHLPGLQRLPSTFVTDCCQLTILSLTLQQTFDWNSPQGHHHILTQSILRLYNKSARSHINLLGMYCYQPGPQATMSRPSMAFPRLFDLPAELRYCIYSLISEDLTIEYGPKIPVARTCDEDTLLAAGEDMLSCHVSTRPARLQGLPRSCDVARAYPRSAKYFAIAYASQRISDEFLHEVYLHHTFNFVVHLQNTTTWEAWNVSDLVLQQLRHVRFVRQCVVHIRPGACEKSDGKRRIYFAELVAKCPRLQTIEIEVQLSPWTLADRRYLERWDWESTKVGRPGLSNIWDVPRERWESSKTPEEPWLV